MSMSTCRNVRHWLFPVCDIPETVFLSIPYVLPLHHWCICSGLRPEASCLICQIRHILSSFFQVLLFQELQKVGRRRICQMQQPPGYGSCKHTGFLLCQHSNHCSLTVQG